VKWYFDKVKKEIKSVFSESNIPIGKLCSAEYDYEDALMNLWGQHEKSMMRNIYEIINLL
jgi:hypothetical protein